MAPATVSIKPGVSVLAVLRHLNYKPWYALAEFVDNSVESFLRHRDSLVSLHGEDVTLSVTIEIDMTPPARISIRDNAAGIFGSEYGRAFRPAAVPPDRSGLAEFGMGMKSAACWFAPRWHVRTSALGEPVCRTVHFDIENIVNDDIEELTLHERSEDPGKHYTEVVLEDVFHVPIGRTVGKLKDHLTDIYRDFVRRGVMDLRFNEQLLTYEEPPILNAPYFQHQEGPRHTWRKDIAFDFGDGLSVQGFAALRQTGNTSRAGFALFRRGRVIQGSAEDGYRPATIFGASNSFRYQRLFGELHLHGFDVSHTKDGFRWDDNEQPFLELLRDHLDGGDLPLLRQAEGYRVLPSRKRLRKVAQEAVQGTTQVMEARLPSVLPTVAAAQPVDTPDAESANEPRLAGRKFDIQFRDESWSIDVALTDDPGEGEWVKVSDVAGSGGTPRQLTVKVSMAHPFMVRYGQKSSEDTEALLRVAAAIALGEILARQSGVRSAGTVRRNVNDILRDALSLP